MDGFIERGYGYREIGYFLEKQEWILYMNGLIETGYGYSGMRLFLEKEDWILYMDYRKSIWIQRNRIFFWNLNWMILLGQDVDTMELNFFLENQN